MISKERPYILLVAEKIYLEICKIKKTNKDLSNIDAIESFIGSKIYNEISSGEFHDKWFKQLEKNNFIDNNTKQKVPDETIKLLKVQRDVMVKQLIQFPDLYYTKSHFPLEISQRAFDQLWRMCESYELWCKETKQFKLMILKIID
tara:strand:+ start:73 stop:510 length:438 start_codon:yes stop_codon:yes gene_type:complete